MSLLLANGHLYARRYPVGMVYVEAQYVVERQDREEATRAVLFQMAAASLLDKKASAAFQKKIKAMTQS